MNIAFLLARGISIAFEVYCLILLIRIILSWVRINPYGKIYRFFFDLTEPLMAPFRKLVFRLFPGMARIGLDFSPIVLLFVLTLIERLLINLIYVIF